MSLRNRREVLQGLGLSGAAVACGLPAEAWWPAAGARGSTLRLAFFTDVHTRVEWDTPAALELATTAVNRCRPELVIAGGDLITDGFQSSRQAVAHRWDAYLEMHRGLSAPVEAVLGNHDLVAAIPEDGSPPAADPRAEFRRRLGLERTWRSLDVGGYRLMLLDSVEVTGGELKYEGRISAEQLRWIRSELTRLDEATPIVLVSHMPLATAFYQRTEGATAAAPANRVVVNSREVLELFAQHNLLLVLQGHLHVDELLRFQRTTFVTGGAISGKWWRGSWHGTGEGFGVVTLRPDRVQWSYQGYGWTARRP